jgi:hypothetical protein
MRYREFCYYINLCIPPMSRQNVGDPGTWPRSDIRLIIDRGIAPG